MLTVAEKFRQEQERKKEWERLKKAEARERIWDQFVTWGSAGLAVAISVCIVTLVAVNTVRAYQRFKTKNPKETKTHGRIRSGYQGQFEVSKNRSR